MTKYDMTKYDSSKFWCFAWSNGTPAPFIIPEVCGRCMNDAKLAACEWFNPGMTWRELYALGGRVVHCTVVPIQRRSRS